MHSQGRSTHPHGRFRGVDSFMPKPRKKPKYLAGRDWLQAGEESPADMTGASIADHCNQFLTARHSRVQGGELTLAIFSDDRKCCDSPVKTSGRQRFKVLRFWRSQVADSRLCASMPTTTCFSSLMTSLCIGHPITMAVILTCTGVSVRCTQRDLVDSP